MDRRKARENAFILLFEKEFRADEVPENIKRIAEDFGEEEFDEYTDEVFFGVSEKMEELDELISKYSIGWKKERMSKVSLTIMRLALYEMIYIDDIPYSVSINEAVELAKKFDHEKSPAFINGILNSLADAKGLKKEKSDE
ncbi:MAG: transcription antitermination factor NusB [Firmicutes bacterium]|nr:transcription antitermination factor NusB [Bacillota bacterium]